MFGKLSWAAIPIDQPIPLAAGAVVLVVILAVLVWVVVSGHLPYLWREWITSVDHKRIGVMYTLLAMVMLLRGFSDAILMRAQQAFSFHSQGFLPPEHYNQIFFRARFNHDLFRRDAVRHRVDESGGAVAARRCATWRFRR